MLETRYKRQAAQVLQECCVSCVKNKQNLSEPCACCVRMSVLCACVRLPLRVYVRVRARMRLRVRVMRATSRCICA